MGSIIKPSKSSILPVSIGLSLNDKKCYYLIWIPSESGPLVIDYGIFKHQIDSIPFDYLKDKIKDYDKNPRFSISLDSSSVKYDFFKSYDNSFINDWNKNNFYDKSFHKTYDSYLYVNDKNIFSIHILKTIKEGIILQSKKYKCDLINLGVGIFSALDGLRSLQKVDRLEKYLIIKFCKRKKIELLLIEQDQFSSYMVLKKQNLDFKIINFFGNDEKAHSMLNIIESIFNKDIFSFKSKIFYYSIGGNKDDVDFISNLKSDQIKLINLFQNLVFDENCKKKVSDLAASSYSELGNLFRGIDV